MCLLGRGDAEANGARDVGIGLAHLLHQLSRLVVQVAAHTGNAKAAHAVHEPLGAAGYHVHAGIGRGGHHAHQRHACRARRLSKFGLFLVGHVGQDKRRYTRARHAAVEPFYSVAVHHVGVRHDGKRHIGARTHAFYQVKHIIGGCAGRKCAQIRLLDDWSFGRGVGKRDAQLNQAGTFLGHGNDKLFGCGKVGIANGDEGDEGLAGGKGAGDVAGKRAGGGFVGCCVIHGCPPHGSGRWRRSLCHRGPRCSQR